MNECEKPLFVCKVNTRRDVEQLKLTDPMAEQRMYVLSATGETMRFFPMNPREEKDLRHFMGLWHNPEETVWQGGYYVTSLPFDLRLKGFCHSANCARQLQIQVVMTVFGVDVESDVTGLCPWIHDGKLSQGEVETRLLCEQYQFFECLTHLLQAEEVGENSASWQEMLCATAEKAMRSCYPWLKVKVLSADSEARLSQQERRERQDRQDQLEQQRQRQLLGQHVAQQTVMSQLAHQNRERTRAGCRGAADRDLKARLQEMERRKQREKQELNERLNRDRRELEARERERRKHDRLEPED